MQRKYVCVLCLGGGGGDVGSVWLAGTGVGGAGDTVGVERGRCACLCLRFGGCLWAFACAGL